MGSRLGQHFLTNTYYAKQLTDSVSVRPNETIIEIGPGKGALTKHLLATGSAVIAVEKDETLAALLHETCAAEIASGQLRIITGDVRDVTTENLKLKTKNYCVAANIPYYITGEIIRQFLSAPHQPRAMSLLIQKEVAERIIARDGKESLLSLSVKVYGMPRIISKVGKGNFNPPPKVDSAIICIDDITRASFSGFTEDAFFRMLHAGFASKRKLLARNLSRIYDKNRVESAFSACGINPKVRAEDLSLAQWRDVAIALASVSA
jgi:16S rRNA (adenine1518-N6/adenine1519-N6)-dimethyltransferase